MTTSLNNTEKENQRLESNNRLLNKLLLEPLSSDPQKSSIEQANSDQSSEPKWSIKEKLFLISFVLINGDSDWTFVSGQLNKWMESISTSSNFKHNQASSRTFSECAKQYKTIVKNYSRRHGTFDLKKIYGELVDERLKELKNLTLQNKQQYEDLYKEIDQLDKFDTSNFEQLAEFWISLRNLLKTNKEVETNIEEEQLDLNIKKILVLKNKQIEKEIADKEAAEAELLRQQKKAAEDEAAAVAVAVAVAEAARKEHEAKLRLEQIQREQLEEKQQKEVSEAAAAAAAAAERQRLTESIKAEAITAPPPQQPQTVEQQDVEMRHSSSGDSEIKSIDKEIKSLSVKSEKVLETQSSSPSKSLGGLSSSPTKQTAVSQSPISTRSTRRSSEIALIGAGPLSSSLSSLAAATSTVKLEVVDANSSSSEDDLPLVKLQKKHHSEQSSTIVPTPTPTLVAVVAVAATTPTVDIVTETACLDNSLKIDWKPVVEVETQSKTQLDEEKRTPSKLTSSSTSSILSASSIEPAHENKSTTTATSLAKVKTPIKTPLVEVSSPSCSSSTISSSDKSQLIRRSNRVVEAASSSTTSSAHSSNSLSSNNSHKSSSDAASSTEGGSSSTISSSASGSSDNDESKSEKKKVLKKKLETSPKKTAQTTNSPSPSTPTSLTSKLNVKPKTPTPTKRKTDDPDLSELVIFAPSLVSKVASSETVKSSPAKLKEKALKETEPVETSPKASKSKATATPKQQQQQQIKKSTLSSSKETISISNENSLAADDNEQQQQQQSAEKSSLNQNTRVSLRNKNPTSNTSLTTTTTTTTTAATTVVKQPRRSFACAKTSSSASVVQYSQSSNSSSAMSSSEAAVTTVVTSKSLTNEISTTSSGLVSIIKTEPVQMQLQMHIAEQTNEAAILSSIKMEEERAYKAWKKSILMVLHNISAHKHATVFMNPVRDDIAPGYKNVVKRPMDLSTIKKNIENGTIKATIEFQRDVMLMFTNAIMYNASNHEVHKISIEMYREVLTEIEQLINTQETIEDKPMRFKEIRSSTTSDKGVIDNNENKIDLTESGSDLAAHLFMKLSSSSKRSSVKDDACETSSIKSGRSSISTLQTSNSKSKSESLTNPKKRRPSTDVSQTSAIQSKPKRRKSGISK
jgi:bromodomain-containing protein 8